MTIYETIRRLRKDAGFTQDDAAKKLNIPRSTYANWETRKMPELDELKKLADLFNVQIKDLLGDMFTQVTYTDRHTRTQNDKKNPNESDHVRELKERIKSQEAQILSLTETVKQLTTLITSRK